MKVYAGEFKRIYDPSANEACRWYINDHTLIKAEDGWHLFGITHEEPAKPLEEKTCAHAFSPDLVNVPFSKIAPNFFADKEAGERQFWAPHVIKHNGLYYMFYCAGSFESNEKYRIHLATSKDLKAWERHAENPMLIDGYDARDPMVLRVDGRWVMYYTCTSAPAGGNHCVAAVFSDDLVHWGEKKVVFTSSLSGTYAGPCESPFAIKVGDTYYLFIGPFGGYNVSYCDTAVYASRDPLYFTEDMLVGHIPAHASEVIRIEDDYYITHCGWGRGGVYLAPLYFEE